MTPRPEDEAAAPSPTEVASIQPDPARCAKHFAGRDEADRSRRGLKETVGTLVEGKRVKWAVKRCKRCGGYVVDRVLKKRNSNGNLIRPPSEGPTGPG